jgi:hypothetical protein
VAGSSAPAHAAGAVHAAPAVPVTAKTVSVHAHAQAPAGKAGALANPLDITCKFIVIPPSGLGDIADSEVMSGAATDCTFDIDGSPATVARIDLTDGLLFNNAIVDIKNTVLINSDDVATANPHTSPCQDGNWTSTASLQVTFPAGYVPPTAFATASAPATLNLGDCPNDFVEVPDVTGLRTDLARSELQSVGLVGVVAHNTTSCDFLKNSISDTSPNAGQLALLGSRVEMTVVTGRPKTPCP